MRDQQDPSTVAELMEQAAAALARRDPQRLEQLERISDGWMQARWERDAQRVMLQAMAEAAEMLLDEPSDLGWDLDDEAA